ncbi:hypothetical protein [Pseudolactococcus insecticola]|uniref:Uncharacterized protein n=1 Tax=Pseudolactococcus insecticola TaxID=2709158 RepID=A0A6A0B5L4_9LACT|nr:hypothetical protein [Lactococcus insecticola]GFH39831.1 hypothetical protein Hs20B_02290 [Lactococcus insecticola]
MKVSFSLSNTKKRKEMISSNDRLHYAVKAKLTAQLRAQARLKTLGSVNVPYSPKKPCRVLITVYSPTRRKLDPPNLYPTVKALIDGMTDAGVWTDDNHEVIKSMTFTYGGLSGDEKYRIEIEVEGERK